MKQISCVVCAFNEEKRIGNVLSALSGHPLISEILVVDDGSRDATKEVASSYPGVRVISYGGNHGKSYAASRGISEAAGEYILTIDADLKGLTKEDITNLVTPVLQDTADASMSLRQNSLLLYRMFGLDFVSGERCFPKRMIPDISAIASLPGYGLEVFMNSIIIKNKMRLAVVWWPHVEQPVKASKIGIIKGTLAELKMTRQIVSLLGMMGVLRQFVAMRLLINKGL